MPEISEGLERRYRTAELGEKDLENEVELASEEGYLEDEEAGGWKIEQLVASAKQVSQRGCAAALKKDGVAEKKYDELNGCILFISFSSKSNKSRETHIAAIETLALKKKKTTLVNWKPSSTILWQQTARKESLRVC